MSLPINCLDFCFFEMKLSGLLKIIVVGSSAVICTKSQSQPDIIGLGHWAEPVSGSWLNPANWEDGRVPRGNGMDTIISVGSGYSVYIPQSVEIGQIFNLDNDVRIEIDAFSMLTVWDRLVNYGVVLVNTQNGGGNARLQFEQDTLISGNGVIELNAINSIYESQILTRGNLVTIGPDQEIAGAGTLVGFYHNAGVIRSQDAGSLGLMITQQVTQEETGSLLLAGTTLRLNENASFVGGVFHFGDNSTLELEAGAVVDPVMLLRGNDTIIEIVGGEVVHPFPMTPSDVLLINGTPAVCVLDQSMMLNGQIILNADQDRFGSTLRAEGTVEIQGDGWIELRASLSGRQDVATILAEGGNQLTIGEGIAITGSGLIHGNDGGKIINHATVTAFDEQLIRLKGDISGGVYEANGGEIEIGLAATINGSEFRATNGGRVTVSNSTLIDTEFSSGTDLHISYGGVSIVDALNIDGNILLEPASTSTASASLNFQDFPLLMGAGDIRMGTSAFEQNINVHGELDLPAGITISGGGQIDGTFRSNSIITANHLAQPLFLSGSYDGGLFVADHSELRLLGYHSNGEYVSRGGLIRFLNARLDQVVLRATDGGDIRIYPGYDVEFKNCYAEVNLDVFEGSEVVFQEGNEIHGVHYVLNSGAVLLEGTQLEGSGGILMRGLIIANEDSSVIGAGIPISGSGRIRSTQGGSISVLSSIIADDSFAPLRLVGNIGPVTELAADGGSLLFEHGLILSSAVIETRNGSIVEFASGDIELIDIENRGDLRIEDGLTNVLFSGQLINNGSIYIGATQVGAGATLSGSRPIEIIGEGRIELDAIEGLALPNLFSLFSLTVGPGQRVLGDGRMGGNVEFFGTLEPSGEMRKFSVFRFVFHPGSRLEVDIAGTDIGEYDAVQVLGGGQLTLGGTLAVDFQEGWVPAFGDRWAVVQGGEVTGQFDSIESNVALPNGWVYLGVPNADGLDLVISCPGDRNGDGVRNFFDIVSFINAYGDQDPSADLNNDGEFSFFDFSAFIQEFGIECGS